MTFFGDKAPKAIPAISATMEIAELTALDTSAVYNTATRANRYDKLHGMK